MKKLLIVAVVGIFSTLFAYAQNPGVTTQGAVTANNCVKFVNRNLIADSGGACSSITFGNPTASVGLVAINGVASTAMRSDGAPALAQNITPMWTGQHTWVRGVSGYTSTNDAVLESAFDGDTYNATQFTSYSATSSVFNGPFVFLRYAFGTPGAAQAVTSSTTIGSVAAAAHNGTSFTASRAKMTFNAAENWSVGSNGTYIGFFTTALGGVTASEQVRIYSTGALHLGVNVLSFGTGPTVQNAFIGSPSAASVRLGATDVDTAPVAQTFRSQGALAGGTSNVAGANWTFIASPGKGTGVGGSFVFQTTPAGVSGTVVGTPTTALTITSTQQAQFAGTGASTSTSTGGATFAGGIGVTSNSWFNANLSWGNGAGQLTGTGAYLFNSGEYAWSSNSGASGTPDLWLTRAGAASIRLGQAAAAAPITQSLSAQGSRPGTDSSIGGGNLFITSGNGTGTGAISSVFLQSPVAVAAGVTAQTMTTGWTINKGVAASTGYTVATLPATPLTGSVAYVTNQLTTCAVAGAALTGGGAVTCPVFYNGTAWVGN